MANVLGYIPFRIIADALATFATAYNGGDGSTDLGTWVATYWPATATDVEELRTAPTGSTAGQWRDVGDLFDYLTATAVGDITPTLTGSDIEEMKVQIYDAGNDNWTDVANWNEADNVAQTFAPQVRLVESDGTTVRPIADASGSDAAVAADDIIQVLVPIATANSGSAAVSPAGTEPPDNALRVYMRIDQGDPQT